MASQETALKKVKVPTLVLDPPGLNSLTWFEKNLNLTYILLPG
jgi:hypothetical protein